MPELPRRAETNHEVIAMLHEMNRFIQAHDRYLALDHARVECTTPQQREFMHIQILEAYLEVQYRARHLTALQYADGNSYAEQN
jgi:hypothetical protein